MPPTAGRLVAGRYFLEKSIGQGGMGVVWRAHDRLLDRKVAVKEFMPPAAIDEREMADLYLRTKREARTAARLNHRGIVTVYDVAEDDGRLWIVMELVPSRSLDKILAARGPLTVQRTARIGQQLLAALTAAHAAGVLHRDVKPGNVLIAPERPGDDRGWRAVLTGFGIAQFEGDSSLTMVGVVLGSPGFTAPERLSGAGATPASDLWSLGATLYAAVEGHGPYERDSEMSVLRADTHEAPPPALSAGPLAPLIAALLSPEPAARPSAPVADGLLAEILASMESEHAPTSIVAATSPDPIPVEPVFPRADDTLPAVPPASEPTTPSRATAHPLTVAARALVVVTALVVGGYLIWQGEASKHLLGATAAKESPAARVPVSPTTVSPTTTAKLPLPPVSTAPGIVQAINNPDTTPPSDYTSESYSAANLGTTAGFAIARPPGWQSVKSGQKVKLKGPNGSYLEVDLTRHVKSDMVAEAERLKALPSFDFPRYQRIYSPPNQSLKKFVQPTAIHQTLGALWEFDWVTDSNIRMRENVLLFNLDQQSYTIYTAGPAGTNDDDWNRTTLGAVSTILRTFKPVPS
jgi:tRNA A-37 threonylcarbamoyl transferase component Bud32